MQREWQIRTEDIDGTEGCETFQSLPEAEKRYEELVKEYSELREETEEEQGSLELIEVIFQDSF